MNNTALAIIQGDELDVTRLCACGCGQTVSQRSKYKRGHNLGTGQIDPETKFNMYVDKNGPNGCWNWTHSLTDKGYGWMKAQTIRYSAHRLSYELYIGPIPKGILVCHKCDNPRCVNPDHLFLGTHKDNADDMVRKNRHARFAHVGESNPIAKLTDDTIRQIRSMRQQGVTCRAIGEHFGLCHQHVSDIANRRIWKHVE